MKTYLLSLLALLEELIHGPSDVRLHQTMLARLRVADHDLRQLTVADFEYWGARYRALQLRHWTMATFEEYLATPDLVEAAAERIRESRRLRQARMLQAFDGSRGAVSALTLS